MTINIIWKSEDQGAIDGLVSFFLFKNNC